MISVHRATPGDLDRLYELGKDVDEFSVNERTVNFWPKETLAGAIASDDVIVLVAEDRGVMRGFIIAAYVDGLKKATVENVKID